MFKEIENELLSIISEESIDRIAHMPSREIAKTMELIFDIKFEDIERSYTEKISSDLYRLVVIYTDEDKSRGIKQNLCPINGKVYHITLFPSYLLNKDENNAITLTTSIIHYVSIRAALLLDQYSNIIDRIHASKLELTVFQSIPVIACAVIRKIYSGPTLSKVIYMTLCSSIDGYKDFHSEEGVNTILNLLDEGLGVEELLDSGFICSIPEDDDKYPGLWPNSERIKEIAEE